MAEDANNLGELIAQLGAPDSATELFDVPESHRAHLEGAELACRHIAEQGTRGVPVVHFSSLRSPSGGPLARVRLALCPACHNNFKARAKRADA